MSNGLSAETSLANKTLNLSMFSLWDTRLDQLPTFHNITLNITKYKLLKSCSIHINLQVTLAIALYFLSH